MIEKIQQKLEKAEEALQQVLTELKKAEVLKSQATQLTTQIATYKDLLKEEDE